MTKQCPKAKAILEPLNFGNPRKERFPRMKMKQDKQIKVFQNSYKSIQNSCENEINGDIGDDGSAEWVAVYENKKKKKKALPKNEEVFGTKPTKPKSEEHVKKTTF